MKTTLPENSFIVLIKKYKEKIHSNLRDTFGIMERFLKLGKILNMSTKVQIVKVYQAFENLAPFPPKRKVSHISFVREVRPTSGLLPVRFRPFTGNFRSTSGPLGHHRWS